jgi:adenosylmethionine-8-amino-7-oxononanoate aminotransferase
VSGGVDGRPATSALQRAARRHLWRHFAPIGGDGDVPILVRGEGCELWDEDGRRYLDALSSLFCVNVGHGRVELADAAAAQARELAYATTWDTAHPRAIELAERIAGLAPGDLNRVFFTSGGSESVESALKLARSFHHARGEPSRVKVVARELAYHGTTFGALSATGLPSVRAPFEPLMPGGCHVPHTDLYRTGRDRDPLWAADAIEERIAFEDPTTVAAVILEPVQNSAGSITPPEGYFERVREICDEHGLLLVADEVITGFGRVGDWFGTTRYGIEPDMMTVAKGITSAYAPLGAVIASERTIEPFFSEPRAAFTHGITFGGHPLSCAIALANLAVFEREDLVGRVQRHQDEFRERCDVLLEEHPMVGDVRGDGYFYSLELVKDKDTKETFTPAERDELIKTFLLPRTRELGVYMRFDDRGETCAQFAPPLVAGPEEFDEMVGVLRQVLDEAWDRVNTTAGV